MFEPISDNLALSQKIVAQISDRIVKGELKPGDRLPTERAMAEQFQVSRTAIRDAIKILSGRDLLEVRHGVGIFVAKPHPSDSELILNFTNSKLRDVFELRQALETQSAYLAAHRRESVHLKRLREILKDAKEQSSNLSVLNERDAQFHMAVAEASQNFLLVKVMWTLLDILANVRQSSLAIPARPQASLDEHERILQAILQQDAEQARLYMLNHLESVESSIAFNSSRQ